MSTLGRRRVVLGVALAAALGCLVTSPSAAATTAATPGPRAVPAASALPVGMRLTWRAGDATLAGTKLVPDPNGWLWKDEQWWSVQSSGGSGGVGLTQVTVQASTPEAVVADVRYFLNTDLQTNTHVAAASDLLVGDATALGDYWVAPARLAAMQPGYDGLTRIWRGPRVINGQTFDTVSSATLSNGSYYSTTYDVATGMLLIGGTMIASPGVLVTDEGGNMLDSAQGAVSLSHRVLLGARQVAVPWASAPLPAWATAGRTTTYDGEISAEFDPASGVSNVAGNPLTVRYVFDTVVGNAIVGRQLTQSSNVAGLPPSDSTGNRVFGSAMFDGLWIPADHLAVMQPQQVLDRDPHSGQTVTFAGVQGNVAVMMSSGPADQLEAHYDLASGTLVYAQYRQMVTPLATQVTTLTLTGQQ